MDRDKLTETLMELRSSLELLHELATDTADFGYINGGMYVLNSIETILKEDDLKQGSIDIGDDYGEDL